MRLVLDSNVVSELMRPQPDVRVLAWIAAQPIERLATTAVNVMEIRTGLANLPPGARRTGLEARFQTLLEQGFAGSVLPFDDAAAGLCAELRAARPHAVLRSVGRPIAVEDAMIAAIARVAGATLVTRDRDLEGCDVAVVDPWTAPVR